MSQPRITRVLSHLQPADHLCWLYDGPAQLRAALQACAQAAARRNAACHVLADASVAREAPAQAPLPGGEHTTVDLGGQAAGPEARQRIAASLGPDHAWVVADLTSAAYEPAAGYFSWLESLWGQAAARSSQLVELYDRSSVPPELLFDLLRSHNQIVWEGSPYANEGALLPPPPCQRLPDALQRSERYLAGLAHWTEVRGELEQRLEELGAFQGIARAINRSLSLDEIVKAALSQMVGLVQADLGYVALWELRRRRLQCCAVLGGPGELAGRLEARVAPDPFDQAIAALGDATVIVDAKASPQQELIPAGLLEAGFSSYILMALRSRGSAQGALVLAAHGAERFGPAEADLLESLAEQIGVALDHASLYRQARRRAAEMRSLYELSLAAASLDPQDILHLIGEHIMRQFSAACFFVALLDEERCELRFAHLVDRGRVLAPFTTPMSREGGLTGHVLETGRPLLVRDLAEPGDLPAAPVHLGEAARSWLGVPLVVKGKAIGVMSVQAYEPGAFDVHDQRLLSLAAQQAASALENARLFQETRALERRYHALLEELNDGYAVLQDGHLVFSNARLGRMLGPAAAEYLAQALVELPADGTALEGAPAGPTAQGGREAVHKRTHLRGTDGSELTLQLTVNRIEYEGRPAVAVLCRDISRQARLEAQLLLAERLSGLGQLVSGVAHELNNPLTTIKGYTQLLQGEQLPPSAITDLKRVEEAADRCRRIVGDLLTFARSYAPERSDTDLNELLQRTVALRSYELRVRSISVEWDLDPQLPAIQADPHRLQQVILNLVFNAEQALNGDEKGRISIRSRRLPDGSHVRFEVADSGPGIRPEHLDRLFDPFFTTKEVGQGTGLGLAISYGIVREHGGRIWAESRYGEGATFFVELPLVAPQPATPQDGPAGSPAKE